MTLCKTTSGARLKDFKAYKPTVHLVNMLFPITCPGGQQWNRLSFDCHSRTMFIPLYFKLAWAKNEERAWMTSNQIMKS